MKVALPLSVEAQMAQWKGTYGYVENVARADSQASRSNVLAVTDSRAKHRIYNIAEPTVLSQADFIRVWLKHLFDAFYNANETLTFRQEL